MLYALIPPRAIANPFSYAKSCCAVISSLYPKFIRSAMMVQNARPPTDPAESRHRRADGLGGFSEAGTPPGQTPIADAVAVIRTGDHHLAVVNPEVPDHESLEYFVFDANWTFQLIISP